VKGTIYLSWKALERNAPIPKARGGMGGKIEREVKTISEVGKKKGWRKGEGRKVNVFHCLQEWVVPSEKILP